MWSVLEDEYQMFLEDMKNNQTFCMYIDEKNYEDSYSHDEIRECQSAFIEKAKEWLHENNPGQYIVTVGWCVFVMTVEEAQKSRWCN